MFNPRTNPKPKEVQQESEQPRDALAALMDGETPDDKSLRFPNEHSNSWRAKPDSESKPSRSAGGRQDYRADYEYNTRPDPSMGEYHPAKQTSTMDSMKQGAANTGTYIKDKSVAGATYMKEKDWSKEKEFAGKAATHTKNGAVIIGHGMAKGAGWLWKSGKNGVDSMRKK